MGPHLSDGFGLLKRTDITSHQKQQHMLEQRVLYVILKYHVIV